MRITAIVIRETAALLSKSMSSGASAITLKCSKHSVFKQQTRKLYQNHRYLLNTNNNSQRNYSKKASNMQDPRLQEFLRPLILTESQMTEVYKRYCDQINKGLGKATNEEAEIKNYITYVHHLPTGEELGKYLALDLGGTNFRVLLVTLKGHHDAEFKSKIYSVPQEFMLGTGASLFDHIAACLADFTEENQLTQLNLPLGFTFSFPCVQLGLTKAILVTWTKGFKSSGVEGEDVVGLLQEAIARRGNLKIDVMAVLNDTTGTLMSCAHRNPDCRIGVIIGTGCNACYFEKSEYVERLEPELAKEHCHVIINCEWGAFGDCGSLDFIRTKWDELLDKCSLNVGFQKLEKMVAGMYLGEICRLILADAVKECLIFAQHTEKVQKLLDTIKFETKHISSIEEDCFPEMKYTKCLIKEMFGIEKPALEDCQRLVLICQSVSERAAQLTAIGISGLIQRIDEPRIVVGIDGSVYRFHPKFDAHMRKTIEKLISKGKQFELMLSEDGSGRGAALVAAVADAQKKLKQNKT